MCNIQNMKCLLVAAALLLALPKQITAEVVYRSISEVEPVNVEVPVGHAPRLPYRLWVKYDNGQGEFRQVRWQNASTVAEQTEADAAVNPVGTSYTVKGYVLGDNTTNNGYPVVANVKVVAQAWEVPAYTPVAQTLPLDKVVLEGDNRLTWNRDLDIDQLISLDVRQQIYNYRDTYGLSTEGYPEADGWD